MKIIFSCACLISALAINAFPQQVTPSPTPSPAVENDVVKISTNLVQVDVTVTDKNGKVVKDLKPEEVEIYQNGKKQDISNFSFISNVRETPEGVTPPAKSKLQPRELIPPAAPIRAENVKRAMALVVDDLNLSYISTYYVQRALRKFVDEQMLDGDLVAIIRTGAGIGALQQFTNDKRQLHAAIDKIHYNALGTGNVGSFAPLKDKSEIEESSPISPEAQERADDQFRASIFAGGTLGALNFVVRGMSELPGRKSIMLFSDGFALYTPDTDGASGRDKSTSDDQKPFDTQVRDAIKVFADQANRASVVIYTMDARGLVTTNLSAVDDVGARSAAEQRQVESDRISDTLNSQQGLKYLAAETGGKAILNSNDLAAGIRKILDDQSYYLVGYQPDDETFDPAKRRFNNLIVKVTRPGLTVRYRSGFFGVADQKQTVAKEKKTVNRLEDALTSPFAVNDISLRLNGLFAASNKDGTYVRALIHVNSQDLTCTDTPDGKKQVAFDLIAVAFGDNGNAVDHLSKTLTAQLKKEDFDEFVKSGYTYNFIFPLKRPGAYQLRVAIRDHGSEKVGSANQFIEIPNLKKKRLTLSSIAVENVSLVTWHLRQTKAEKGGPTDGQGDVLGDTAVRRFKRGSVLNYGLSIFNAKGPSSLTSQTRLFRDGKPIFEGNVKPIIPGKSDPGTVVFTGSLNLGSDMAPGDYVMEILVQDGAQGDKHNTAVQFVQFELVD